MLTQIPQKKLVQSTQYQDFAFFAIPYWLQAGFASFA
jgi:hypothetical protein